MLPQKVCKQAGLLDCEEGDDGEELWAFTPIGITNLLFVWHLEKADSPWVVADAVPLDKASSHELLTLLLRRGWEWKKLPQSLEKRRALPAFSAGKPKIFYTGLHTNNDATLRYLADLLDVDRLGVTNMNITFL